MGEDCGGDGEAAVGDHQDGEAGQGHRVSGDHNAVSQPFQTILAFWATDSS